MVSIPTILISNKAEECMHICLMLFTHNIKQSCNTDQRWTGLATWEQVSVWSSLASSETQLMSYLQIWRCNHQTGWPWTGFDKMTTCWQVCVKFHIQDPWQASLVCWCAPRQPRTTRMNQRVIFGLVTAHFPQTIFMMRCLPQGFSVAEILESILFIILTEIHQVYTWAKRVCVHI